MSLSFATTLSAAVPIPTATEPARRPIPRQFLERVSRALLVRILARHEGVLAGRAEVSLAAMAASAQTDRAQVDALWRLLGAPPPELAPLHGELLAIADIATAGGHEVLLARDVAGALDHELGDEDCAATAFLDHRALFDTARPQSGSGQAKSFASFQSSTPLPFPELPTAASHADDFARRMSKELVARGRSDHFQAHEWRSLAERHFEIVYGRLATTRDVLGKSASTGAASHVVKDLVTDRTTERAHAVFHDDTYRLDVAGPDWIKELVRRAFGEAYFGSASHFEGNESLTLAPLSDLATALAVDGVPGLKKVELHEVWIDFGDGSGWVAVGAPNACSGGTAGHYVTRALAEGTPVEATFHVFTTVRTRPVALKLAAPRRMEFDRRDARVVRTIRDWVVARGFMTLPEHLQSGARANGGGADDAANDVAQPLASADEES
jgi:hypothetical protein